MGGRDVDDDLVSVPSESAYRDLVSPGFDGVDPAGFERKAFRAKGVTCTAYRCAGVPRPGFPNT
ncbi:hypothetical protein [Actinosynnema sp. NPDC020468]|uniref:hypothetical protein n=1 Tax=Actinosynnema sp. NPDC020468 TaxID=3154488 RepID=UPI00340754A4